MTHVHIWHGADLPTDTNDWPGLRLHIVTVAGVETATVQRVVVDYHGTPVRIHATDGWVYPWTNIVRLSNVSEPA